MICPKCKNNNDMVIDSRNHAHSIRRRRVCVECGYRYTTVELLAKNRKAIKTLDNLACNIYNINRGSGNG